MIDHFGRDPLLPRRPQPGRVRPVADNGTKLYGEFAGPDGLNNCLKVAATARNQHYDPTTG